MDLIPEAPRLVQRSLTARQLLQAATALSVVFALALPIQAQAQESDSSSSSSPAGATSLGSGLGGTTGTGGSLAVSAPMGGGFGLGNGVLQNTALGGGMVNLRDLVDSPIMESSGRAFDYIASIGVFAGYTDNTALAGFGGSSTSGHGSTFERVNPLLGATVDLNRIQGSANYQPSFYFYNSDTAANHSSQSLNGQFLITLVPDALFIRTNVFATVASSSQLSAYNGVNNVVTNSSTQVYSYVFNPYFMHSFGDTLSVYAGYNFTESFFESLGGTQPTTTTSTTGKTSTSPGASNSATQSEYFTLTSGPAFELLQNMLSVQAAQFYGQDLTNSGNRNTLSDTVSYAWSRFVSVFGQFGYQNLHYAATSVNGVQSSKAYTYNGLTGSGGARFTPNDLSQVTLSYGFYDGGNVFSLLGRLQPTPRIVLVSNSSTSVTTNGQDLSSYATSSTFAATGSITTPMTGAPTGYVVGSTLNNPAPYRITRSSLSAIYSRDVDSLYSTLSYASQNAVAAVSTAPSPSTHSLLASIGWQHSVSDTISLNTTVNYGQQYAGASGSSPATSNPMLGAVARLSNNITPTITAEFDYIFQHQQVYATVLHPTKVESMNEIYAGMTKRF